MSSITVRGLGKAYKRYATRKDRLYEWLLPGKGPRHSLNWVLEDISFVVEPGEAVGVIGVNGAGKSTLLKLIAGTTQPTTGEVQLGGQVAALLELGMGFHPDFTGRQNALLAGQLLGHSIDEVNRLMPEVERFAEIGDYFDQPVRVYSSGMQVRLAFSVATAKRPDVLIVDEALSVGDAHFQHISFDRIRKFREAGTTLLMVSHDKQAIMSICDRAILLNNGKLAMEEKPEAVMDYYNALIADKDGATVKQSETADGRIQTASGTGEASVMDILLLDEDGRAQELVDVGETVRLHVKVRINDAVPRLVLGYGIKDRLGQFVFGTNTHQRNIVLEPLVKGDMLHFDILFSANLGPGTYSVVTALTGGNNHLETNYEWRDLALIFRVVNKSKPEFTGLAWLEPTISYEKS